MEGYEANMIDMVALRNECTSRLVHVTSLHQLGDPVLHVRMKISNIVRLNKIPSLSRESHLSRVTASIQP